MGRSGDKLAAGVAVAVTIDDGRALGVDPMPVHTGKHDPMHSWLKLCLDLPGFSGERLAHFPSLSLEGDRALEVER